MTDINLKTLTPDTSLPTTGFLFGADSQASTNPSVYSTQTVATTLLGSTSLTGDVLTTSAPVLNLTQQWNSSGTTFTGLKFNVDTTTYNQSAAASLLMDLQVGGSTKFNVDKTGNLTLASNITSNLTAFNIGCAGTTFINNTTYIGATAGFTYISSSGARADNIGLCTWSAGAFAWTSSNLNTAKDTFLTRKGAANLQLGTADAASPVAQTLSVQSVVAGTTGNVAGKDWTFTGSQGVGSGAGGSLIFQVAPAGSAGTAQNTLSTALTITGERFFQFRGGASSSLTFAGEAIYAMNTAGNANLAMLSQYGIRAAADVPIGFSNSTSSVGTQDVFLYRDAANTLALKNSTNAQEFRVYETTTGPIYKAILGNRQLIKISGASFDNGAGASAGTMTNAPAAGNPTKWIPIDDNGTTRYIPAW